MSLTMRKPAFGILTEMHCNKPRLESSLTEMTSAQKNRQCIFDDN